MKFAWLGMALLLTGVAAAETGSPVLIEAAQNGDTAAAVGLIRQGAAVNAASGDGTTALMWAAHRGDRVLVEALLEAHADVRAVNNYGSTATSEAAGFGDVAVLKALLAAGGDPDSPNADGQTALMRVARAGNVPAAQLLLAHGAHINAKERLRNQTALHWAAAQSQADMVKLLLQHHADLEARSMIDEDRRQVSAEPRIQWRRPGGMTPLLYAARQGCLACVDALLKAGADPNLPDPDGISPMLMATENLHFDVAALLLKKGANPNQWDWWGRAPLYAAVDLHTLPTGGRPDHLSLDVTTSQRMIELLLQAGANPNAQLKLFPPFRSIGADRGADLLLTIGTTPLIRAAKAGDVEVIQLLLAHGANPSLPNSRGITPLMAAAGLGSDEIDTRGAFVTQQEAIAAIDVLLAKGADVNVVDDRGQGALHGAAYRGWNEVVKHLVAQHADLYAKDLRGFTPMDTALGHSDGHGRNAGQFIAHEDTAAVLKQLMAETPPPTTPSALRMASQQL